MTKITKSIVSITLTTIMITSTMAIKANAANTNQELKWRNDTYYSTSTFNAYNKTFSTYVKNGSKKETKVPGYNSGYGDVTFSLKGTNNSIYAILSKSGNTKEIEQSQDVTKAIFSRNTERRKGHMKDALALGGDEGRDKLR